MESVRAQQSLQRFGLFDLLGKDRLCFSVADAVAKAEPAGSPRPDSRLN
jgi:hypothetical protein